jgi:hypothetical protein
MYSSKIIQSSSFLTFATWKRKELDMTSNRKELLAIERALDHFQTHLESQSCRHILIQSDNTTAVYNINRKAAASSLYLDLRRLINKAEQMKLSSYPGSGEQNNGFTQPPGAERGLPNKEVCSVACIEEDKFPSKRRPLRKDKQQNFTRFLLIEKGKSRKKRKKKRERSESDSDSSRSNKVRKCVPHKVVKDEPTDSSSHSSDFKKSTKVRRGKGKRRSNSAGLERSTLECTTKKAKRSESNPRCSRESINKRKSHEQERIKTASREHVSSSVEIKPNSSKLTDSDNDNNEISVYKGNPDAKRYKSLQRKLERSTLECTTKKAKHEKEEVITVEDEEVKEEKEINAEKVAEKLPK